MTESNRVAAAELRAFVERIESIEVEAQTVADVKKEAYAEIKHRGYDPAIIRKIVAMRKKDPEDLSEEEAVMDVYKDALGM